MNFIDEKKISKTKKTKIKSILRFYQFMNV